MNLIDRRALESLKHDVRVVLMAGTWTSIGCPACSRAGVSVLHPLSWETIDLTDDPEAARFWGAPR